MTTSTTGSTSITLTDEQAAALAPLFAVIGVSVGDTSAPADQTPSSEPTGLNAGGRLVYLDGPLKGKFAPKAAVSTVEAPEAPAENGFVTWLHDTAEARSDRKRFNANASAWIREQGLVPNGEVWALVKKGERKLSVLKAAGVRDAKARAAAKAANA